MNCLKCGYKLENTHKIHFRDICPKCMADLHCCKMCKFYTPGKPNDCAQPFIDNILDKEKSNLCEEFKIGSTIIQSQTLSMKDIEKKLFG
jgi:hypothetical protein